jgi:hypothetical protein
VQCNPLTLVREGGGFARALPRALLDEMEARGGLR